MRKGYRENFTKLWKIESTAHTVTESAILSSSDVMPPVEGGVPAPAPAAPAPRETKAVAKAPAVATPKAKGSTRKAGEADVAESPEQLAKKVQKKEMDIGFRKLSSLRTRMASSSSTASDIAGYTNRDRKWSWAKGDSNDDLKKASS